MPVSPADAAAAEKALRQDACHKLDVHSKQEVIELVEERMGK